MTLAELFDGVVRLPDSARRSRLTEGVGTRPAVPDHLRGDVTTTPDGGEVPRPAPP